LTKGLDASSKMKILLAPLLLAVSLPAFAEVDPKIHKLCIEAKDYSGCVRAMKGETSTETTVNQIQRQGASLTEGNSCPAQHIYSGSGYCQRVVCVKRGLFGRGHAQALGGKGINCQGGAELTWDNEHQPVRASLDKKCPANGLEIGYSNTCLQAKHKGYIELIGFGYDTGKEGKEIIRLYDEPAKSSGLLVGDKIVTFNIRGLSKQQTLKKMKAGLETTDILLLTIERNGKQKNYELKAAPNKYPLRNK